MGDVEFVSVGESREQNLQEFFYILIETFSFVTFGSGDNIHVWMHKQTDHQNDVFRWTNRQTDIKKLC